MKDYVFDVSNMKCGGCVSAVKTTITELAETKVVEISLDDHLAMVSSAKSADEIAAAITAAGFPAELK